MRLIFRLFVLVLSVPLFAVGTQFLSVPGSALEMSSLNILWLNPAISASMSSRPTIGISYGFWLAESRAFTFQLRGNTGTGSAALRMRYLGFNDLELRTNRPTDDPLANFSAFGATLETVYNRMLGSTRIGLGFKVLRTQVYTSNSTGWAVDLGAERRIGTNFSLGLSLLNLGRMSIMEEERPTLPLRSLINVGYNYTLREMRGRVTVVGETSSHVKGLIFGVGNELHYKNLAGRFTFRSSGEVQTFSGGVALQFGIYQICYSLQMGNQFLGYPQLMDVSVRLP